ncbi:MAG: hypothetical protein JJ863_32545 [Deltaproteobacteria bacterium]|nr:hypothetical protein [Deltaproteobacteria bacterium]
MSDAYQQEHMAGGEVLLRQKAIIPRWALGLIAGLPTVAGAVVGGVLGALGLVSGLAAAGIALAGLGAGLLPAAISLVYAVGRLVITTDELHLQIGMSGPRIPIEAIESVAVGRARTRNKGLGYKRLFDGTRIYSLLGDWRKAVKLTFVDQKPMHLVCVNPEAVAEAIRTAMASKGRARVRVAVDEEEAELEVAREVDERAL